MSKVFKKIFTNLLCLLLLLNISMVKAEGFTLIINQAYPDLFEFPASYNLVGGAGSDGARVQFLTVEGNGQTLWSWCIEPSVATRPGANYVNNNTILTNSYVNNIVRNYYLDYDQDADWKYYAVQVAIWAAMANEDPAGLATANWITVDELKNTVNDIRNLAHELWANRTSSIDPYIEVNYESGSKRLGIDESGTVNLGNLGDTSDYYLINDELYWKVPKFTYYKSKGLANIDYRLEINVEDALVINYKNDLVTASGGTYPVEFDGNPVEIYVPVKEDGTGASIANGQIVLHANYKYLIETGWDGSASNSQSMISIDVDDGSSNLVFNFTYPIPVTPVTPTAELTIVKKGSGPYSYTTSTVDGETLYTIENRDVSLKGAGFEAAVLDSADNPTFTEYLYRTNSEGKLTITDFDTNIKITSGGREAIAAVVGEYDAPDGYYYDENLNAYGYILYKNAEGKFVYEGDPLNLMIENDKKTLTVNVRKEDTEGNALDGVAFGLYTTQATKMANGTIIPAGSLVDYGKTSGGIISLGTGLPVTQNYILKEVSTISGYNSDIEKIMMNGSDVTGSLVDNGYEINLGNFISNNEASKTINFVVSNKKLPSNYDMKICKYSANDRTTSLQGAEFTVTDFYDLTNTRTVTTQADGCVTVNLPEGTYTVKETVAPNGYMNEEPNTQIVVLNATTPEVSFYNYKKPTITIEKVGKNGGTESPLSGATFKVENESGEIVDVAVTGANGKVDVTLDKYGTYKVSETIAPSGYIKTDEVWSVTVDENTLTASHKFVNKIKPELTIEKVGISESGTIPLSGTKFEIYKDDVKVGDVTTGADGRGSIALEEYAFYQVKEVSTNTDYILDQTIKNVDLTADSQKTLTISNYIKPTLTIHKTDETGTGLGGAKFQVLDSNGNVIADNVTTLADGSAIVTLEDYGIYFVKEIAAPEHYLINEELRRVEFVRGTNSDETITVINNSKPVLTIEKVGVTVVSGAESSVPLSGVAFKLTKTDDASVTYTTDPTGADGKVSIELDNYGEYLVEETNTPEGYIKADSKRININSSVGDTLIKNYKKPTLTIEKVDETNHDVKLQGAKFEVKDSDGNKIKDITTDENGIASATLPDFGDYTVTEVEAPDNYIQPVNSETTISVTKQNTDTPTLQIANIKKPIVTIIKKGVTDGDLVNSDVLEGAKFKVTNKVTGKEVETAATGPDGKVIFKVDTAGTYYIEETKTPDGYIASDKLEVDVTLGSNEFTVYNHKKPEIKITKTDSNGNTLTGAVFNVKNSSNASVGTITAVNGTGTLVLPEFGTYTVSEITAPVGYALNTEVKTVTVDKTSQTIQNVSFINYAKPTLKIVKVDKDDATRKLSGAKFEIKLAGQEDWVELPLTDNNGETSIVLDKYGQYEIKETTVPEFYEDEHFTGTVNITTDRTNYEITVENNRLDFEDLVLKFKGIKYYQNEVAGTSHRAEFILSDGTKTWETNVTGRTIDSTPFNFPDVVINSEGHYEFTIIESDADFFADRDASSYKISLNVVKNYDTNKFEINGDIAWQKFNEYSILVDEGTITELNDFNAVFTNTYTSSGSFSLKLNKTFEAGNNNESRPFLFTVDCGTESSYVLADSENYTATIDFNLNTTSTGNRCVVKEHQLGDYDYEDYQNLGSKEVIVTYDVIDNGQGLLQLNNVKVDSRDYTVINDVIEVSIQNKKIEPAWFGFVIHKDIENKAEQSETEAFMFDIYNYDIITGNKTNRQQKTVTVSEGDFEGEAPYSFAINTVGDHFFYISEKDSEDYDELPDRIVNVRTKRNADKTALELEKIEILDKNLVVLEEYTDDIAYVDFVNEYIAKPVTATFKIAKNTNVVANLPFIFTVKSSSEKAVVSSNNVVINANALTSVSSGINIRFDEPGVYDIKVKEGLITGDAYKFWTFDRSEYTLRYHIIKVNDLEIEKLEIIKDGEVIKTMVDNFNQTVTFKNTYFDNTPVKVSFQISKEVKSTDLKPSSKEKFKFKIEGTDEVIEIKDGSTVLHEMSAPFNEGTYLFKIFEINDGKENYKYDDSVYQLRISVVRDNNKLKPIVTLSKNGTVSEVAKFTNIYTKNAPAPDPKPESPKAPVVNTGI